MQQKQYDFTIIFDELEKVSKDPAFLTIKENTEDCEEIQAIREIVLDVQSKPKTYFAST